MLAAQLAQARESAIGIRTGKRKTVSFLFDAKEADQHDLDSVRALALNGFAQLKALDSRLAQFEPYLLSDAARSANRHLMPPDQTRELDLTIKRFLCMLSPHFMLTSTTKVLEWLVRHFSIHEYNVDDIMSAFLPYLESPHFAKMLSILNLRHGVWSGLTRPATFAGVLQAMVNNSELARFVFAILPTAIDGDTTHRSLVAFNVRLGLEYIDRVELNSVVVAFLLPAFLATLKHDKDCMLGSLVLITTLARRSPWAPSAVITVVEAILRCGHLADSVETLASVVAIFASQLPQEILPESVIESLFGLNHVNVALAHQLRVRGSENFFVPFFVRLTQRPDDTRSYSTMESILSTSSIPHEVLVPTATAIIKLLRTNMDSENKNKMAKLLSIIHQRHPEQFQVAISDCVLAAQDTDERQVLDMVIMSVAKPAALVYSDEDADSMILFSQNSNAHVRATALADLVKSRARSSEALDRPEVAERVLGSLKDSDITVIGAIYADTKSFLQLAPAAVTLGAIVEALRVPDLPRPHLRLHLNFVNGPLIGGHPDLVHDVFRSVLFPYLFFSKPRQKTATVIWEGISNSLLTNYSCLRGCSDIFNSFQAPVSTSDLPGLNTALIDKIAANVMASNEFSEHLAFLVSKLGDPEPHSRVLSHLTLRSLLNQLSGEHQVRVAREIIRGIAISSLDSLQDLYTEGHNLLDLLNDEIIQAAILKPSSMKTTYRLQGCLLALMPMIQRPPNMLVDWLAPGTNIFIELVEGVYVLANSTATCPSFSTSLTRALFLNLGQESLLFLARIWGTDHPSDTSCQNSRVAALCHARAFILAYSDDQENVQDFQMVLPFLVTALLSRLPQIRGAAIECISSIRAVSGSIKKAPPIYAFGLFPETTQVLDWPDVVTYVQALKDRREFFVSDFSYASEFHSELLRTARDDPSGTTRFKTNVLCYLLSHVISREGILAKVSLLKVVRGVTNPTKLATLRPLFLEFIHHLDREADADRTLQTEYFALLLGAYDANAVTVTVNGDVWADFIQLFQHTLRSPQHSSLLGVMLKQLQMVFQHLELDRQCDLACLLLRSLEDPMLEKREPGIRLTLGRIISSVPLMSILLAKFQPTVQDGEPSPKRQKMESLDSSDRLDTDLAIITVLAEIIVARAQTGSLHLLIAVMDMLAKVIQLHIPGRSDLDYLEHLLMTSIGFAAQGTNVSELDSTPIRVDVLVNLMRVSNNGQSFHQALLLIATMVPLAPDSILHHVMPIFTFMGSNIFHRDDEYSFRVVQKTVESVVPVLVTSLKHSDQSPLELILALKPFLRVFTDAATHIPRHRRSQFFIHLIAVLGNESLAPVCMLIIDKVSNKVARQGADDAATTLALPLAIIANHDKSMHIPCFAEFVREAIRLLNTAEGQHLPTVLTSRDGSPTENPSPAVVKKQLFALLFCVNQALSQLRQDEQTRTGPSAIRQLILLLLQLLTMNASQSMQIMDIARLCLSRALRCTPAVEFLHVASTCLQSDDPSLQIITLELLTERLPKITSTARQSSSHIMLQIITQLRDMLSTHQGVVPRRTVLEALTVITQLSNSDELSALNLLILPTMAIASGLDDTTAALNLLCGLTSKLGPRMIPHLGSAISLVSKHSSNGAPAITLLLVLLKAIPTFWGIEEVTRVASICINMGSNPDNKGTIAAVSKSLAKRVPTKTVIHALLHVWESLAITPGYPGIEVFLRLLQTVLHVCPRSDIAENVRPLFKCFLDIFGIPRCMLGRDSVAVSAFLELVIKLNDTTFKPMFRRLLDWAYGPDPTVEKQIAFNYIMTALTGLLKGLVVSYTVITMDAITHSLAAFASGHENDQRLWLSLIHMLQVSFCVDDIGFWTPRNLGPVLPNLCKQLSVCASCQMPQGCKQAIQECLQSLLGLITDDTAVKALNLEILMLSRSEDAQIRLLVLNTSTSLWEQHGSRLSGFVADTTPFVHECADDENDEVAKAARKLRAAMERVASLDGLL